MTTRLKLSTRAALGVLIVAGWLVGLGMLGRRELMRGPVEKLAEAAMRVNPGAVFFEVLQGDRHIGYASSTIDTAQGEIQVRDVFVADLMVGGGVHRASAQSSLSLSRRLALKRFDVSVTSDSIPFGVAGTAEGDSAIVYTLTTAESRGAPQRLRTDGPILMPTLVPLAAMLGDRPKVGRTVSIPVFDPMAMATKNVGVTIVAESLFTVVDSARLDSTGGRWIPAKRDTIRAWQLRTESRTVSPGWVDEQGRVVESAQAGGLVLRRTAYELAFENWRIDRATGNAVRVSSDRDVLETTAIAASAPLTGAHRERLRVRLRNVSVAGFDLPGGRQTLTGDVLTVQKEGEGEMSASWALGNPAIRRRFRKYLQPEPLLESNSPTIRETARRILGGESDPRRAAEKLNRWVHDSVRKVITVSIPSALQVLTSRRGDCNEHTQLYLALARSVGLPARGAAGLAYLDGKFYYHAWPEVFLGSWVAVDPTFGQMPADAGHLRFVSGGFARQTELLRLIGSLRIDILEMR